MNAIGLTLTLASVSRCPRFKPTVWTVNEVNDLKLCTQLGVDVVITDMPARAVSELGYP